MAITDIPQKAVGFRLVLHRFHFPDKAEPARLEADRQISSHRPLVLKDADCHDRPTSAVSVIGRGTAEAITPKLRVQPQDVAEQVSEGGALTIWNASFTLVSGQS